MRLLILDQFSDPGGAQRCLLDLLPAIRQRGWQALVALPGEGELFERVRALGFETARVDCGPYSHGRKSLRDAARFLAQTPRLARQIRKLTSDVQADLVYINGPRLLPAAALAGLGFPVQGSPVVFHSHSYLPPGLVRKLAGAALRRMDARVIACCRFVAQPWRPHVRPENLSVIYNGVPGPAALLPRPREGPPRVGCIGRIAPEKGQREFLAAASIIRRAMPDCRFWVYGAPLFSEPRYSEEVRAAAAGMPVEFAGWIPDVYAALAGLDLILVPSAAHEATTRVIVEAFAAGVPVVAFRSGGIPEVVDDGGGAWLADSVEEMARIAVDFLTAAPEVRAAVSQAARDCWCRRFTLDRWHDAVIRQLEIKPGPAAKDNSSLTP
jgi:glycosyltransferase involved in cell wall biosynthesis